MRRTGAGPRRHRHEYAQWGQFKRAGAKGRMRDRGRREIPYASEVECREQAARMADHSSRLLRRTVRALDNHRPAEAKLRRLFTPAVRRSIAEAEHEHVKEWNEKLARARSTKR